MFLNLFSEIKNNAKNSIISDDPNFKVSDLNHCCIVRDIRFFLTMRLDNTIAMKLFDNIMLNTS